MARPTSLTPELAKKLTVHVGNGLPISVACDYVGIHYATVCRWMKRDDGPYPAFRDSMKKARAKSQKKMIRDIRAGVDNWQARAWYLERSDPKHWGRKDKIEKLIKKDIAQGEGVDALLRSVLEDPAMRDKVQAMLAGKAKEMH
jgi:hypothetical protein